MTLRDAYQTYKAAKPGQAIAATRRARSTTVLVKADDGGSGSHYAHHLPPSVTRRYRAPVKNRYGLPGTLRLMVDWANQ